MEYRWLFIWGLRVLYFMLHFSVVLRTLIWSIYKGSLSSRVSERAGWNLILLVFASSSLRCDQRVTLLRQKHTDLCKPTLSTAMSTTRCLSPLESVTFSRAGTLRQPINCKATPRLPLHVLAVVHKLLASYVCLHLPSPYNPPRPPGAAPYQPNHHPLAYQYSLLLLPTLLNPLLPRIQRSLPLSLFRHLLVRFRIYPPHHETHQPPSTQPFSATLPPQGLFFRQGLRFAIASSTGLRGHGGGAK